MREFKFRAWINLYSHWHMTNEVQYVDDKTLECTIEKVTFSRAFLPLNVGSNILNGQNVKVLQTECLTLDGNGNGAVSKMPIGEVNVFLDEDTVMTVSAGAAQEGRYPISVPSMAGQMVNAIYEAYENVEKFISGELER